MPDTPIDQSEGIQSVRLKVPTAEVPIPPEGFAQLHSPAPGELALRLPDGSVVAIGGGGGGGTSAVNLLGPNGQVLTDGTEPGVGIDISPIPPLATRINGPLQGASGRPYLPPPVVVTITSAELMVLNPVGKVLIPGVPGAIIVPLLTVLRVGAGSPYTPAGGVFFLFGYGPLDDQVDISPDPPANPLWDSSLDVVMFNYSAPNNGYNQLFAVGAPFGVWLSDVLVGGTRPLTITTVYLLV